MVTNLALYFCVRASSAFVRTSAFLQPVVHGQVYIFEISPPLEGILACLQFRGYKSLSFMQGHKHLFFIQGA